MSGYTPKYQESLKVMGRELPVHRVHTLVIGSGAAALKAADRLHQYGIKDMVIVSEGLTCGTSFNTGSDKQTYFRLSTGTPDEDSPYLMAEDLYSGGSMHGDHALIEAIGSTEAFHFLASLGVPFPRNRYGAYIGYKTDHDSRKRGSSIGPYTSKKMVEVLLGQVRKREISILDRVEVVSLISDGKRVCGALAIDISRLEETDYGLTLFMAENIVFGTGGPGGIYRDSVYPGGHSGAIGLALEIGAGANNLQESQFGLSSVAFRWNVSGSYQQVIPAYISTDKNGEDEREFLQPFFPDTRTLCQAIFLKGYQWPFDTKKISSWGSSLIDILVYRERVLLGRRVFLDYRRNPSPVSGSVPFSLESLSEEARVYLEKSDALGDTPIERLTGMNPQAVELYRSHRIDLETMPLEIAVSAQHNNGGLAVDLWWESVNMKHLFPVGEAAGTHGVTRPGGSALNAGQVGASRAAEKIAGSYKHFYLEWDDFAGPAREASERCIRIIEGSLLKKDSSAGEETYPGSLDDFRREFRGRMSDFGSMVRKVDTASAAEEAARKQVCSFERLTIGNRYLVPKLLQSRHLVLTHWAYLSAIAAYLSFRGGSRGSSLVLGGEGESIHPSLEKEWKYISENPDLKKYLLSSSYKDGEFRHELVPCRAVPEEEFWFETTWKAFREKTYLDV